MKFEDKSLNEAIQLVSEEIEKKRDQLIAMTKDDECYPVQIEGYTSEEIEIYGMVPGYVLAEILLEYDYPLYAVLDYEPPREMHEKIAHTFGFDTVDSFDL